MRHAFALLCCLCGALPAAAACTGRNQIDLLPAPERAALIAAAEAAPFAEGNLWRATKGEQVITLAGTFHLDDPRHAPIMARITPLIDAASVVLVEAGPKEEAALKQAMAADPSMMFTTDGPTLPESLPPEVWAKAQQALRDRSIPPFLGAKMQPGYLSLILSIPPCATGDLAEGVPGLDKRIIARASERGIPVRALESFETLFRIMAALTPDEQRRMLAMALASEGQAEDAYVTLADTYFTEQSRLIWELTRLQAAQGSGLTAEQIEADFALMEEVLILSRNRAWVPVIEAAAAKGPVFAAFGALHLSGDEGVLNLLAAEGYRIERLPL